MPLSSLSFECIPRRMRPWIGLTILLLTLKTGSAIGAPSGDEAVRTQLEAALKGIATRIEISERLKMGMSSEQGNFVATLADGAQVGLFVARQDWSEADSPYFWVPDGGSDTHNAVFLVRNGKLVREKVPKSDLATDFGRSGKTRRSASMPAGNANRTIRSLGGGFVCDTGFVTHSLMKNAVNQLYLVTHGGRVHQISHGVNHARNESEARGLLKAMETLIPGRPK